MPREKLVLRRPNWMNRVVLLTHIFLNIFPRRLGILTPVHLRSPTNVAQITMRRHPSLMNGTIGGPKQGRLRPSTAKERARTVAQCPTCERTASNDLAKRAPSTPTRTLRPMKLFRIFRPAMTPSETGGMDTTRPNMARYTRSMLRLSRRGRSSGRNRLIVKRMQPCVRSPRLAEGGTMSLGRATKKMRTRTSTPTLRMLWARNTKLSLRITVRNLRIREDTAKYLINLDPDSAYYDPKTRSMRDNPSKNVNPEDAQFAGDNFLRNSGEAVDVQKLQLFAWQSAARGNDVHLNANPTQGQILHQQYREKKDQLKSTSKVSILAKYGGEEYLEKAPKELLNGQTEDYVEYSRTGQIIKGRERAKVKSKYEEDAYVNNHTSVWGSWYQISAGKWGYACCHSTLHGSYCAGEAGIEAAEAAKAQNLLIPKSLLETHLETAGKGKEKANIAEDPSLSKKRLGEKDAALDKEKLQRAIAEEKKRKKGDVDDDGSDKRRKYGGGQQDVTEEELEAYRMHRSNYEDPMANYKDTEI
ncbi:hypothetical protein RSAG8_05083, partial [Rhizoctonia solani AG-8 WAC10335]